MTGKLTRDKLETFLADAQDDNGWRAKADLCYGYTEGRQIPAADYRAMIARGQPPLQRNYIGATIRLLQGMEAKARTDLIVRADAEQWTDTALAQSALMKAAERGTKLDWVLALAYRDLLITGAAWVHVGREADPFKGRYRAERIHRREIIRDWRETDIDEARFLVRRKWFDADTLAAWFPEQKTAIKRLAGQRAEWDLELASSNDGAHLAAVEAINTTRQLADEWADRDRERLLLYEVYYRNWVRGLALVLPDGRVRQYDPANRKLALLAANGVGRVRPATFPVVRLSYWIGPLQVSDTPSPYPHNRFPYVEIVGIRDDISGAPIGMVDDMLSPQDDVNARIAKMHWLLSAKRIIADSDASARPWAEVVEEAGRPDAVLLTNPDRRNKNADAFRVESDFGLAEQQFKVLQDAVQAIRDASGVHDIMFGLNNPRVDSGVGVNSLIEQGATTLASINDAFVRGRIECGEMMLALINEDTAENETPVEIEHDGTRRVVVLNQPAEGEHGPYLSNAIAWARTVVDVGEVPQSPSFKMQQMQFISELAKSMPEQVQLLLAEPLLRMSDLPNRNAVADQARQLLGVPKDPKDMTPQEMQAAQQQAQLDAEMQQLTLEEMRLKVAELAAKGRKTDAEATAAATRAADSQVRAERGSQEIAHAEESHALEMDERVLSLIQQADNPNPEKASPAKAQSKPKAKKAK